MLKAAAIMCFVGFSGLVASCIYVLVNMVRRGEWGTALVFVCAFMFIVGLLIVGALAK